MHMTYGELGHADSKRPRQGGGRGTCDWCSVGVVAGLAGGIGVGVLGAALTAASWLTGTASYVRLLGTALLVTMIPLLVVGAHCLDLTETKKAAERKSRFGGDD